jgi:hypothetical protein
VSTEDIRPLVKNVEALEYVITEGERQRVKIAMAVVSVTTEGERPRVKNAVEAVFASMGRTDNIVKIVVAVEYVNIKKCIVHR